MERALLRVAVFCWFVFIFWLALTERAVGYAIINILAACIGYCAGRLVSVVDWNEGFLNWLESIIFHDKKGD